MPLRWFLLVLVLFTVDAHGQTASAMPEGDQDVAAINEEFEYLTTALTLFTQSLQDHRSVDEVAHSLDVLADEFDRFFARLTQFAMWLRLSPNATGGLSESGKAQFDKLGNRTLPKASRSASLMAPYQSDQRIVIAEARITESCAKFQQLTGLR